MDVVVPSISHNTILELILSQDSQFSQKHGFSDGTKICIRQPVCVCVFLEWHGSVVAYDFIYKQKLTQIHLAALFAYKDIF